MPSLTAIVPATNRPATLPQIISAIETAEEGPEELLVVREPSGSGPAAARNSGATAACGDVLVFVDADVEIHSDGFRRIRAAFEDDPGLTAVLGSYDAAPAASSLVSQFRNLLHHHVHQSAAGAAATFWGGLGAVRRDAFLAVGGFDAERFPKPSVEDIELGMRLVDREARIELDPQLLGKHLKSWSLVEMVRTDVFRRGAPWTALLLRARRPSSALNLGWVHRISAAASVLALVQVFRRRPGGLAAALAVLLVLNRSFYALLWRRLGPRGALIGVLLHMLHHASSAVAAAIGTAAYARERLVTPASRSSPVTTSDR